tara:strand:+ start:774 stop:1331 length:558 start_codon:yes stop_codon:yes gene_type:complete
MRCVTIERPEMEIGKRGLNLIKEFEGLRLDAYLPTPVDIPTIGYGHTLSNEAELGMTITEEEADRLLRNDLFWVEDSVHYFVKVDLNQNQYDALCSFVFNLGATNLERSTLLKKLNEEDYEGAGLELLKWDFQGRTKLRGLTRRREAELELFRDKRGVSATSRAVGALRGLLGPLRATLHRITAP